MTLTLAVFWIIVISLFAICGSYYARRYNRPDGLIALYVTVIVISNIVASKTIEYNLGFTTLFASAATIMFSVTFLLTDIVNERFGKKETQRMILIALFSQIILIVFSYLVVKATPAPFFTNQLAFESIFGLVPRIVIASFIAFYISENLDAQLFHWFKRLTNGKHLWMRNVFSSLPSMFVDSTIFVLIAFWGIMPIVPLIIGLTVIKWLVGIVDIPFMYLSRAVLGRDAI
ncbi:queuosine precursor transporter [Candidatus Parcubacteria bacterium]|nr:queuosine precursor transporter [Candidatus Parcubacteria bacterium]